MKYIIEGKSLSCTQEKIHDYLFAAHTLFLTWSGKFTFSMINSMTPNTVIGMVRDFIPEGNNGSWNNLQRGGITNSNSLLLKNGLLYLVNYRYNYMLPDINDIENRLTRLCSTNAYGYIKGMSIFFCTAVLFANDNKNFMVIDQPVREYFRLGNKIKQLNDYNNVIQKSQKFSNIHDLDMWYINKAYGIWQNNGRMKIWNLGKKFLYLGPTCEVKL